MDKRVSVCRISFATLCVLALAGSPPLCVEASDSYQSLEEVFRGGDSQTAMTALSRARESQMSARWDEAAESYEDTLLSSLDCPAVARECLQGLQAVMGKELGAFSAVEAQFEHLGVPGDVAEGWTSYSVAPPYYLGGAITFHVADKTRLLANGNFGGIDSRTKIPLAWTGWGSGIEYITGNKAATVYRGELRLPNETTGIYQRISGLIVGKLYKFGCIVANGSAKVGVDPTGGTDPNGPTVVWQSETTSFFSSSDPEFAGTQRVLIKVRALQGTATLFLKGADERGATIREPYVDLYPTGIGSGDRGFLQELDATQVTGTGELGDNAYYVAGIRKSFPTQSGAGILAKVRGFLNSPGGTAKCSFRVGIDPHCGTDALSANVKWSDECWNSDRANTWVDAFVSSPRLADSATAFVEFRVRCKGFDATQHMTLLLNHVWVVCTDVPMVAAAKVAGVAEHLESSYSAFAVQEMLSPDAPAVESTPEGSEWSALWRAEALRMGGLLGRLQETLASREDCDEPENASSRFVIAQLLIDALKCQEIGPESRKAYGLLRKAVEALPADALSAPARLHLAQRDWRKHPDWALGHVEALSDECLTPQEQIAKRRVAVEACWKWKKVDKAEALLREMVALCASYGDTCSRANANLMLFQLLMSRKTVDSAQLEAVVEDLSALEGLSGSQAARSSYDAWLTQHPLGSGADYLAAANAMKNVYSKTPESAWTPVLQYLAFDLYLRAGKNDDARAVLKELLQEHPNAIVATRATERAYDAGLMNTEGEVK